MRLWLKMLTALVSVVALAGGYPPAKAIVSALDGGTACGDVSVQVSGFDANETVTVSIGSASTLITVDGAGSGSGVVSSPNISGSVPINAVGQSSGRGASATTFLGSCDPDPTETTTTSAATTTAAVTTTIAGATTTASGALADRPGLPVSGSSIAGSMRLATVALVVGVLFAVLAMRRRRPSLR